MPFDPRLFEPLPDAQRRSIDDDFVAFALRRDGRPDVARRRLERREEFFERLAETPRPAWDGDPIDPAEFARWHRGERPLSDAPPLVAWLVQVARANEGEGWGVEYLLDRGGFDGLGGDGGGLRPRDFADLEETYHTRIMREICRSFGVDFELREPPRVIRESVKMMSRLPRRASYMLLLAGELMGTVAFARMAARGEELLEAHPAMQERVRMLMDEILVDEVGHVTFLLGSMKGWQLAAVRRLSLAYAGASGASYGAGLRGEVEALRRGLVEYGLDVMPERVLRRAFVPEAYWPRGCGAWPGMKGRAKPPGA